MSIMISIIAAAQQKIDTLHHQMKSHVQELALQKEAQKELAKSVPLLLPVCSPIAHSLPFPCQSSDNNLWNHLQVMNLNQQPIPSAPSKPRQNLKDNGKSVVAYKKKSRGRRGRKREDPQLPSEQRVPILKNQSNQNTADSTAVSNNPPASSSSPPSQQTQKDSQQSSALAKAGNTSKNNRQVSSEFWSNLRIS